MPTSQVPTYLAARVATGYAVPSVEVVSPESQKSKMRRGQAQAVKPRQAILGGGGVVEEEKHAVLEYVVQALNEQLLKELLEGFPL
jgi:hypothetical protein